ncbi:hypothetical protein G9A89_015116 [Geosiphon pyriformis]|nr:hypothetical protein G9A89_015116 [Geosiphon pyriformis]
METESSPSLVSGAPSGGAWKTITSCQRFAGWVISILVLGATFKIKLAHVKTVFQSVHGFLGAKSVSKDNVKLFCVEFASQQSLETAFLVELTSSVHLATLKIAKSLVVSESGFSSATIVLRDVPLGVSAADIKMALGVFDKVAYVVLKPANVWQYVVVYFKKLDAATAALNHWSILVGKDSIRIFPVINQNEAILSCDRFKAKLVNLPSGCTAFEISDMIFRVEVSHLAVDCKVAPPPSFKTSKVFKPHFVGSLSYAKAFASSVMSEFPSLVASVPPVTVVDPAVGSRLDSLEKQISNLAALIKSIVKPIGFLVALISHFLDDNAVKNVQLEKDLLSMKYAFNNFANLLVGVSKNIACFRSKVDFDGIDYNNM